MGLFSKLFGTKAEEKQQPVNVSYEVKSQATYIEPEVPELQGDYAKTVFLWAHEKASPLKRSNEYAKYFLYECGIRDAAKYHKGLISEGYFCEATEESKLSALKVSDLKAILKQLEQSTTGKKDELIKRILQYATPEIISNACQDNLYELTEKGLSFLKEHNDYVMLHKHGSWGVSWKEYDKLHKKGYSFFNTMWGVFNQRLLSSQNYGRNEYLNMYQLLELENKRERALEMLLRVLYIDLSGVEGMSVYRLYKQKAYTKKEVREYFSVAIMLAPGILQPIAEYRDIYSDAYIDKIYEQKLPIQICSKELFVKIVHSILDDTFDEVKVEEELRRLYNKAIDEGLIG